MFKNTIHNRDILKEIEHLVKSKIVENKQLEYKSELPGRDSDNISNCLLKPVCSFANTNDGFIIYGIKEENKIPAEIIGVHLENIDEAKLRIENLIRDNTEYQITGTDIAVHELEKQDQYVVILKVRKSWYGPHRETRKNLFYGRNSSGSYPMDMAEIRNAINLSDNLIDNVNKFKTARLIDIEARQTIVPIESGACMVLHVISLPSFMLGSKCSMQKLQKIGTPFVPTNFRFSAWNRRIVLEGLLGISPAERNNNRYDLLYRSGRIESVTVFPPQHDFIQPNFLRHVIPSQYCEELLMADTNRFLQILKSLDFQPPIIIFLSYLGIKDYSLGTKENRLHKFDRDVIQLSSEIVESFDVKTEKILLPLFDAVWHCCGLMGSENYREKEMFVTNT